MKRNILIFSICIFFISACKQNEKVANSSDNDIKEPVENDYLEIRFRFKSDKPDQFKIKMTNIVIDELQTKNIEIIEEVNPSTDFEDFVGRFDDGNMSKRIAINLGNKEIKKVYFKSITVSFRDRSIVITNLQDINKYIKLSKYVDLDVDNKIFHTKRVEGKHFPTLTFTSKLFKELNYR